MTMASTYLPSWLHLPNMAGLRRIYNHPVTLGTAILAYVGLSTSWFLIKDYYSYYVVLPADTRGTLSRRPSVYFWSGSVRLVRAIRGLDGTDARPIRRFAEVQKYPK
ncbi:hypothetical protein CALCODRAFT_182975 [Calocera cornea HHB12733]|uniref:Uncharacterized protein n=1 Tax=Calocera cornea HHB12733 TaxID=1353952 RepID=A0A165HSJ3_9BASI|nr:hypothetical protein CALCODRAFT_182975 [Calocera cornea HHB12733]